MKILILLSSLIFASISNAGEKWSCTKTNGSYLNYLNASVDEVNRLATGSISDSYLNSAIELASDQARSSGTNFLILKESLTSTSQK